MASRDSRTGTLNQVTALAFGATYALVGLAGFLVTDQFYGREGDLLLGFQVNHLHNLVHLLIGVALVAASKRLVTARSANLAIGATYIVLAVLGPFIQDTPANVVALNGADHVLHLLSGLLLTVVAATADKRTRARV